MLYTVCFIIIILFLYYILRPWKLLKDYDVYLSSMSIFENQLNSLIRVYADQKIDLDVMLDSREISQSGYKELLENTYKHVLSHIPEYVIKQVSRFLTKDEIQLLLIYKIDLIYKEHYAGSIVEDSDLLDYDSEDGIQNDSKALSSQEA